jgi:acyl transferase domain-containing protein
MTDNLIQHIENLSEMTPNHFADIAYTLQMGRAEFNYRRMVVGKDKKTILEELKKDSYHSSTTKKITNATNLKVVFMFSGQGSQYNDMARNLYTAEPEFAKWIDYCLDYLNSEIKPSVRSVLFGGEDQNHVLKDAIHNTRIVQSVLFIVEYALAKFLISLGIQPAAMIGHSIGEYVAATLAEVMDLEDVLNLIYRRGRLMSNTVSGAMLVVELSKDEITAWVQAEDVTIAAVNSLSQTVISGGIDKINKLEEKFKQQGIVAQRLKTSHAFHSHLMEPILAEFRIIISKIILKPPMIPFVSNVTGTWIQPEEATDPNYWTNHLRHTVLFEQGIKTLIEANYNIYLEVGVGKTLAHFVHAQVKKDANVCIQYTLPSSHEKTHDQAQFLFALGQLWLSGILPVWKSFYKDEQRQRIPLPTYPFDRQLYWVPPDLSEEIILPTKKSYSEWFYEPSWTRHSFKNNNITLSTFNNTYCWVLLLDRQGIGKYLNSILLANQQLIVKVAPAKRFKKLNDYEYQLDITNKEDYIALARNITNFTQLPLNIINLLSLTNEHDIGKLDLQEVEYTLYQSFYSILFLSQAFLSLSYNQKIKMTIIGNEIFSVNAEEPIYPAKATIIGTCRVIPAEHDIFNIQVIDLLLSEIKSTNQKDIICKQIILNVLSTNKENHANLLAYRKNFCWHQVFQPVDLRNDADFSLRQHGVYVFTGGLGGISLTLAKKIAQMTSCPRLILLSRSVFPLSEMGGKRLSCADC